jgi:hypothetical protein
VLEMTQDQLFLSIIESPVFKAIDQSEALNQFFLERTDQFFPDQNPEYQKIEEKRKSLEQSILKLVPMDDRGKAEKIFNDIEECFFNREHNSNKTCYQQGFSEACKFLIRYIDFKISTKTAKN